LPTGTAARRGSTAIPAIHVPVEHRGKVTEYLARVNYGIYLGRLEMDLDEGGVRMTATVNVRGSRLSLEMLGGMENVAILGPLSGRHPGHRLRRPQSQGSLRGHPER